ncbi:MAG: hypothetical protein D6705_05030 [Deltaproteobacteria bacterium]|nr:MAG: hypothetical protein D6705_05030 [Deltaproteobacteria bacterium]
MLHRRKRGSRVLRYVSTLAGAVVLSIGLGWWLGIGAKEAGQIVFVVSVMAGYFVLAGKYVLRS